MIVKMLRLLFSRVAAPLVLYYMLMDGGKAELDAPLRGSMRIMSGPRIGTDFKER